LSVIVVFKVVSYINGRYGLVGWVRCNNDAIDEVPLVHNTTVVCRRIVY
jgi:hypothetical protein